MELVAAAAWLAKTRIDGMILPSERATSELLRRLIQRDYSLVDVDRLEITPSTVVSTPKSGRISLLTSGTTGEPKVVEHTWDTLFTMGRVKTAEPRNWLVTYQPGTYAWWQMVTMLLFHADQELSIPSERTPVALIELAISNCVTAISATPTFWRMVMLQFTR